MSFGAKYNTRSPAVKRLMREAVELREPTDQYCAQPLEDNLFEWHFTVRGASDTEFAGGVYHGRVLLPPEYPMKPPSIMLLTPNGRFEIGQKICLSMSAHHPETWQPSWSIRTVLLAIIGFMPSKGEGAIGALDYPKKERKILAVRSIEWKCDVCGAVNGQSLLERFEGNDAISQEAKELASQISFKGEKQDRTKPEGKESTELTSKQKENVNIASDVDTIGTTNMGRGDVSTNEKVGAFQKPEVIKADIDSNAETDSKPEVIGLDSDANIDKGKEEENSMKQEGVESQSVVRKRTNANKNSKASAAPLKNGTGSEPSQGKFTLVLVWMIVIALVVLILRRLCMDSGFIGKA